VGNSVLGGNGTNNIGPGFLMAGVGLAAPAEGGPSEAFYQMFKTYIEVGEAMPPGYVETRAELNTQMEALAESDIGSQANAADAIQDIEQLIASLSPDDPRVASLKQYLATLNEPRPQLPFTPAPSAAIPPEPPPVTVAEPPPPGLPPATAIPSPINNPAIPTGTSASGELQVPRLPAAAAQTAAEDAGAAEVGEGGLVLLGPVGATLAVGTVAMGIYINSWGAKYEPPSATVPPGGVFPQRPPDQPALYNPLTMSGVGPPLPPGFSVSANANNMRSDLQGSGSAK
jgi:hypothetical protein